MKFILFRHAHKGITPFEDPELSLQGFEQAAKILTWIQQNELAQATQLWVSPKRRTSQTFYPVSRFYDLPLQIKTELDQHSDQENNLDFRKRVQKFLNLISENADENSVIMACTHYDWIEEAMSLINCDKDLSGFEFTHWSPTQYVAFEIHPNENHLWKFIKKGSAK